MKKLLIVHDRDAVIKEDAEREVDTLLLESVELQNMALIVTAVTRKVESFGPDLVKLDLEEPVKSFLVSLFTSGIEGVTII